MSYSFSVSAADKAGAMQSVKDQMAAVVKDQPVHSRDEGLVHSACEQAVSLLTDDAAKDVALSVCGSLGWSGGDPGKEELTSVNVGVTAYLVPREAAQ